MNSSLISLTTYDREISHPQLKKKVKGERKEFRRGIEPRTPV